jgi:hypothetical protein
VPGEIVLDDDLAVELFVAEVLGGVQESLVESRREALSLLLRIQVHEVEVEDALRILVLVEGGHPGGEPVDLPVLLGDEHHVARRRIGERLGPDALAQLDGSDLDRLVGQHPTVGTFPRRNMDPRNRGNVPQLGLPDRDRHGRGR